MRLQIICRNVNPRGKGQRRDGPVNARAQLAITASLDLSELSAVPVTTSN